MAFYSDLLREPLWTQLYGSWIYIYNY